MAPWLFRILLVGVVLYALLRGGRDERAIATLCLIGSAATLVVISPMADRFAQVEMGVVMIDLAMLAGFMWVALHSQRFWPLWVAGLQLTTMLGHLLKGAEGDLIPRAYGAALTFWAYPILLILAIGTWRSHRRWIDQRTDQSGFT